MGKEQGTHKYRAVIFTTDFSVGTLKHRSSYQMYFRFWETTKANPDYNSQQNIQSS